MLQELNWVRLVCVGNRKTDTCVEFWAEILFWAISTLEDEFEAFNEYLTNEDFSAKGGDESEMDYEKWLKTLERKPAPIQTHLGSIEDFFDDSLTLRRISVDSDKGDFNK